MSVSLDQEIRTLRTHFWSDRDPEGRAFAPLADAYRRKGDLAEAESLLKDGLGRLPDFATGRLVAALVKRDQGHLDEAMSELDRLLELDSRNVLAMAERAGVSLLLGDREGAIQDANRALELEPGHEAARAVLQEAEGGAATGIQEGAGVEGGSAFAPESTADVEEEAPFRIDEHMGEPGEVAGLEGRETDEAAGFQLDPEEPGAGGDEPLGVVEGLDLDLDRDDETADPGTPAAPDDRRFSELELPDEPAAADEPEAPAEGFAEVRADAAADAPTDADPDAAAAALEHAGAPEEPGAPEAPVPGARSGKVYTRTLGDLYARQGFFHKAVEVYEHLVQGAPDDQVLSSRLAELREKAAEAGPEGGGAPAPTGGEVGAAPQEPEDRAPQWMEAGAGDEVESAFAWTGEGDEEEGPPGSGRPIGAYLNDLMAWVPGAVPIHTLAPEDAAPVPIASLAPDGGGPDGSAIDGGSGG